MANWTAGRSAPSTGRDRALGRTSGSTEVESQRSQVLELAMAEGDSKGYLFFRAGSLGLANLLFHFSLFFVSPQVSSVFSPVCALTSHI